MAGCQRRMRGRASRSAKLLPKCASACSRMGRPSHQVKFLVHFRVSTQKQTHGVASPRRGLVRGYPPAPKRVSDEEASRAAITISDDYDPLSDAALANSLETEEELPTGSRGRDREESPEGEERGRERRDGKAQGRDDRSRTRSPRRTDDTNGTAHKEKTTVVKCRGLPYSASERDVRDFFDGCVVERDGAWQPEIVFRVCALKMRRASCVASSRAGCTCVLVCVMLAVLRYSLDWIRSARLTHVGVGSGVVICKGRDGRPSGDCFVKFRETEDFEKALKRDRAQMQRRYIEVFASTDIDMESGKRTGELTVQRRHDEDPHYQGVVRMRGLPFSANPSDIQTFFRDLKIREGGVSMCMGRDGRPNGEVRSQSVLLLGLGVMYRAYSERMHGRVC